MTDRFDELMREALEGAAGSDPPSPAGPAADRLLAARAAGETPPRRWRRLWGSLGGPGPVARWPMARWSLAGGAAGLVAAALAALFVISPGAGSGGGSVATSGAPERTAASPATSGGPTGAGAGGGAAGATGGASVPPSGSAGSAAPAPVPVTSAPVAPTTTAPIPSTAPPTTAAVTLGSGDDGRTVTVAVGTTIHVRLSNPGYAWTAPTSSDPSVLQPTASGSDPATGTSSGDFVARTAGSATLSATGRPQCPAGQACPALVRLWRVTIRVAPAP